MVMAIATPRHPLRVALHGSEVHPACVYQPQRRGKNMTGTLTVSPIGDRDIVIAQTFDAGAARLFTAFTSPDQLRVWLLGPPGWMMTTCEVDLRPGGAYRYQWRNEQGVELGLGGAYREVAAPSSGTPGS